MNEIVLDCGCHKVTDAGQVFTRLEQFSQKGKSGFQTRVGKEWKPLAGCMNWDGYVMVRFHGRSVRLHRLVAVNFIPNPNAYPEAQHKDGNKLDNRASNLKWGTQKHNAEDRENHGHTVRGSKCPHAKLNEKKVRVILRERNRGATLLKLARQFQVSKKTILLIAQGKIWRHVANEKQ